MRDDQHRLGREILLLPKPQELGAQVLRGEDVECRERLVHQEGVGFDDQGAGETHPLAHPAGELLGVGGLEAVQADAVDRLLSSLAPLVRSGPQASSPSSTFWRTVSQGNSAKLWNTMATPGLAPLRALCPGS